MYSVHMTTDDIPKLRRYQRVAWAMMLFGILASLGGNVLYAPPDVIAQTISALPAFSFLGTMWLLERIPWDWRTLTSHVARGALIAVAGISAWISYWHMVHVALQYGQEDASAHLLPGAVDGLILACSMALLRLGVLMGQALLKKKEREALALQEEEAPEESWMEMMDKRRARASLLPPIAREEAPRETAQEEAPRRDVQGEASRETVLEETTTETKTTTRRVSSRGGSLEELVEKMREGVREGKTPGTITAAKGFLGVGHSRAKEVMKVLEGELA